jgi:hypothetical protein
MDLCKVILPVLQPQYKLLPRHISPYRKHFLVIPQKPRRRLDATYTRKPPRALPSLSLCCKSVELKSAQLKGQRSLFNLSSLSKGQAEGNQSHAVLGMPKHPMTNLMLIKRELKGHHSKGNSSCALPPGVDRGLVTRPVSPMSLDVSLRKDIEPPFEPRRRPNQIEIPRLARGLPQHSKSPGLSVDSPLSGWSFIVE